MSSSVKSRMTPDELRQHLIELKALSAKATPGPWNLKDLLLFRVGEGCRMRAYDCEFIAAARNHFDGLIDGWLESLEYGSDETIRALCEIAQGWEGKG